MLDQRLKIKTENRRMEQVDDCQVSVYILKTFNRIYIYKQIDRRWPPSEILVARLYFPSVSPLSNVSSILHTCVTSIDVTRFDSLPKFDWNFQF